MCTKATIYHPLAKKTVVNAVAVDRPVYNLRQVNYMTDTLVKLANRMEKPIGEILLTMKESDSLTKFYCMTDGSSKLTQRQVVNRMAKELNR